MTINQIFRQKLKLKLSRETAKNSYLFDLFISKSMSLDDSKNQSIIGQLVKPMIYLSSYYEFSDSYVETNDFLLTMLQSVTRSKIVTKLLKSESPKIPFILSPQFTRKSIFLLDENDFIGLMLVFLRRVLRLL